MRKYVKMQIIKHALQYYLKRPEASQEQFKREREVLKQVEQEVLNLQLVYQINNKQYIVKHVSGIEFQVEANGQNHARKKAFAYYKGVRRNTEYSKFIGDIEIEEIKETMNEHMSK